MPSLPLTTCVICTPGTSDSNCVRNRLEFCAWEDRQARMICNSWGRRDYLYSISPFSKQFLVHPLLNSDTVLIVVWDGLKMNFSDNDIVPWPEWAAEAVAAYVKWKILLEVDKRIDLAREWYDKARQTGIYPNLRLSLFREQNEAQEADGKDEEYAQEGSAPVPLDPLTGFGAQFPPLLTTVTQLEGTDKTALAGVPTILLTPPFAVLISIGNGAETWILTAGTDADDPTNGILRPADYATTTNERVWLKQA